MEQPKSTRRIIAVELKDAMESGTVLVTHSGESSTSILRVIEDAKTKLKTGWTDEDLFAQIMEDTHHSMIILSRYTSENLLDHSFPSNPAYSILLHPDMAVSEGESLNGSEDPLHYQKIAETEHMSKSISAQKKIKLKKIGKQFSVKKVLSAAQKTVGLRKVSSKKTFTAVPAEQPPPNVLDQEPSEERSI